MNHFLLPTNPPFQTCQPDVSCVVGLEAPVMAVVALIEMTSIDPLDAVSWNAKKWVGWAVVEWKMLVFPSSFSGWWFQFFLIFTPIWGKISILTNIFQMGWNHQLEDIVFPAVFFQEYNWQHGYFSPRSKALIRHKGSWVLIIPPARKAGFFWGSFFAPQNKGCGLNGWTMWRWELQLVAKVFFWRKKALGP